MSDVEKIVKIIFSGEDQVSRTARDVAETLSLISSMADRVSSPLAKAADAVLATDAALLALAAGGLAYAYTKSVDFESSSTSLAQVLEEDLLPRIPRIQQEALALSAAYGTAATGVLDATTEFKKAGFELDASLNMAEAAMRLVLAAAEAGYEVGNASSDIIAILKGFNAEASETTRVTDILNKVSNDYATSVVELSGGMAKLAPLSSQAGFSFEETAGLLVPVIERFRSGVEASEAFKTTLLRLTSSARPVTDALEVLGVAQQDANGKLGSSRDIYYDVAKAFESVDASMKPVLVQALAGTDHAAKMMVAFDGLAKTTAVTNTALASTGAVAAEVAMKLETSQVALDRYGASFQNLAIVVGTEFKDSLSGAINGMTEIQATLQQLVSSGAFDDLFNGLRRMGGGLETFFRDVAKALPEAMENVDFSGLVDSLGGLGDAIMGLFGELDLGKAKDLETFIQTTVDMLQGLVNITSGMVEGFKPFIDPIREFFLLMAQDDTEAQKAVGQILAIGKAVNALGLEFAAVLVGMQEFGANVSSVFNVAGGAVQVLWNTLTGTLRWLKLSFLEVQEASFALAERVTFGGLGEQYARDRARVAAEITALKNAINEDGHDIFRGFERIGKGFGLIANAAEGGSGSAARMRAEVERLASTPDVDVAVEARNLDEVRARFAALGVDIGGVPDDVLIKMTSFFDAAGVAKAKDAVETLPKSADIAVKPFFDRESFLSAEMDWRRMASDHRLSALIEVGMDEDQAEAVYRQILEKKLDRTALVTMGLDPEAADALLREAEKLELDREVLVGMGLNESQVKRVLYSVQTLDLDREAMVGMAMDVKSAAEVEEILRISTGDRGVSIEMNPDRKSIEETKKVIEGAAPEIKTIEAILGFDKARMENTVKAVEAILKSVDNAVEWEAKLEIAEVEANAKKVEAIISGLSTVIESTGGTLNTLFGTFSDLSGKSGQWEIEKWIREEMRIRQEAHDKQLQMSDAEMRLMEARMDRYRFGDPLITVSGDGLQPHLQEIMLALFKQIQITASEEWSEFLFGGGGL